MMSPNHINRSYGASARLRNSNSPTNGKGKNNDNNKIVRSEPINRHQRSGKQQQHKSSKMVDIPVVPIIITTTSTNNKNSKPLEISIGSDSGSGIQQSIYREKQRTRSPCVDIPIVPSIITTRCKSKQVEIRIPMNEVFLPSDESSTSNSSSSNEENYVAEYVDDKYRYDKNAPQINDIQFHEDVPYLISDSGILFDDEVGGANNETSSKQQPLSLERFYQKYRSILPPGLRHDLRTKIAQNSKNHKVIKPHKKQREIVPQTILSYRDEKNAIEIFNPWFIYTELLHKCRVDYHVSHRSIDLLTMQSLDKDTVRELFVVLYGQKYMIHAPDIHTEFHRFMTDYWKTFSYHPEQIWIDIQGMNEVYGPRSSNNIKTTTTGTGIQKTNKTKATSSSNSNNNNSSSSENYITSSSKLLLANRNPSFGSLTTIQQSNKSFTARTKQQQMDVSSSSSKSKVLVEL